MKKACQGRFGALQDRLRQNSFHRGSEDFFSDAPRQRRQRKTVFDETQIEQGVSIFEGQSAQTGIVGFKEVGELLDVTIRAIGIRPGWVDGFCPVLLSLPALLQVKALFQFRTDPWRIVWHRLVCFPLAVQPVQHAMHDLSGTREQ